MDIAMPLLNGLEATRQILKDFPDTNVLILSAHSDDAYVEQVAALGAAGFLLKQTSSHDSGQGDSRSPQRKHIFQPFHRQTPHRDQTIGRIAGRDCSRRKSPRLTSREVEVLQLIAEGKANKEIASELGISIKTVEKHRQHLMEKLNIHDIAGLTRYAIRAGIIESSVQLTII